MKNHDPVKEHDPMKEHDDRAQRYDLWADGYGEGVVEVAAEASHLFAGHRRVAAEVYRQVRMAGAQSVLDVGTGHGLLTRRLYGDGLRVAATDADDAFVRAAKRNMPDATIRRYGERGPLPEAIRQARFDAILVIYAMRGLSPAEKLALLHRLYGLLSPGGVLYVAGICFETEEDLALARRASGSDWDARMEHLVYETFRPCFPLPLEYAQVSPFAGILRLRKPRMVLFDYGGTLAKEFPFDSLAGMRALWPYLRENPRNLTPEEADAFLQERFEALGSTREEKQVEIHNHALLRFAFEHLGLAFSLDPACMERIQWDAAAPAERTDGIDALIEALQAGGIRMGVISNIMYSGDALQDRLDRLFPQRPFEFVIATSEYVLRKPSPLIFSLALAKAGIEAGDAWYCGDSFLCDIAGATGAGLSAIWYAQEGCGEMPGCSYRLDAWPRLTAWMAGDTIENQNDA